MRGRPPRSAAGGDDADVHRAGGTVFHHNAGYSGDAHIAPAIGEPSVEVPIDDLVAFVAHVVAERRKGALNEGVEQEWGPK